MRRGEAAGLVAVYQQAQAAEAAIRQVLARLGIRAEAARPVVTVDDGGCPVVGLRRDADERDRFVREMRTAIGGHKRYGMVRMSDDDQPAPWPCTMAAIASRADEVRRARR